MITVSFTKEGKYNRFICLCVKVLLKLKNSVSHLLSRQLSRKNHSLSHRRGFPDGSVEKNLPANVKDAGSVPESARSPGERKGNPLQYSCLEHPKDRGAWGPTVHGITELDTTEQLNNNNQLVDAISPFFSYSTVTQNERKGLKMQSDQNISLILFNDERQAKCRST